MRLTHILVLSTITTATALTGCQSQPTVEPIQASTAANARNGTLSAGDELGSQLFANHEPAPSVTADSRSD